ncbi:DUF7660 family protein [Larkinella punicea]|uniref:DUF7660 domain-containing protein n=1 Tax=Larkinella punicea TaxID=2315727 RepID=A0A368JE86_9BACT|nr:hypothetical protein [Larkinella punicea]RCR65967.1 hypothetical protein DUE52_29555 [Larkinella punicea]
MNVEELVESINTKEDFISFVTALINDLKNNPDTWENRTLFNYLEALQSWTEDMDGYYYNKNISVPKDVNWKFFANILIAAKSYE